MNINNLKKLKEQYDENDEKQKKLKVKNMRLMAQIKCELYDNREEIKSIFENNKDYLNMLPGKNYVATTERIFRQFESEDEYLGESETEILLEILDEIYEYKQLKENKKHDVTTKKNLLDNLKNVLLN